MSQSLHPYPVLNALIGINRLCAILSGAVAVIGLLAALAYSDLQTGVVYFLCGLTATVSFVASAELIVLILRSKADLTEIREHLAELSSSVIMRPNPDQIAVSKSVDSPD